MKVTQFETTPSFFLRPYELKPTGGRMGGADVIEVRDTPNRQKFTGFGVAVTGSSCYNLNLMPEDERKAFLDDIYSDNGLGLSICRLSVGSSDYSAELYSYDDENADTRLEHFTVGRDDEYIVPMIKEVLNTRPDAYVFASPWSPPGWMKTGGSMCGGYMREQFIDCYAEYIIRFIEEYKKRGIRIDALTAQNETETDQAGRMPACIWHPDIEAKFIIALKKRLEAEGIDVKVWMNDHNFSYWRKVLWQLDTYPEIRKYCDGAAFHYYDGSPEDIDNVCLKYPELEYHFTEGGPRLYDNYATDWCKWGIVISKALKHGCATFTGWNLMLDEIGGPNIGPFFCGGLVTRNSINGELSYSGQYRAFGHFSKFIKRGAEIFPAATSKKGSTLFAFPDEEKPAEICAALNPDGKFILTVTNPSHEKRQLQYYRFGKWWYIEALPDSVSTVVFEEE